MGRQLSISRDSGIWRETTRAEMEVLDIQNSMTTANPPMKISVSVPTREEGSDGDYYALLYPLGQDGQLWDGEVWDDDEYPRSSPPSHQQSAYSLLLVNAGRNGRYEEIYVELGRSSIRNHCVLDTHRRSNSVTQGHVLNRPFRMLANKDMREVEKANAPADAI